MKISKKYSKEQLYQLAFRDKLTGAYNRNALEEVRAEYDHKVIWVSIVDIDNLKQINDRHGHAAGDIIIAKVAKQLIEFSPDTIRLGGDEFLMLSEKQPPATIEGATIGTVQKFQVYDCQTRDDLGAMTMYVPVSKEVSAADCPEYAVEVLQKLVEALKGKYYTAQSRQYNGDRPSGRMYGIGEAIDLLTDTADRIKKGEYHG